MAVPDPSRRFSLSREASIGRAKRAQPLRALGAGSSPRDPASAPHPPRARPLLRLLLPLPGHPKLPSPPREPRIPPRVRKPAAPQGSRAGYCTMAREETDPHPRCPQRSPRPLALRLLTIRFESQSDLERSGAEKLGAGRARLSSRTGVPWMTRAGPRRPRAASARPHAPPGGRP
ncbi:uncharacterized protein LOC128932438 isoform X2 [Callithrix jacchus]